MEFYVTNNPLFYEKYHTKFKIQFLEVDLLDLFITVRNYVHASYLLQTHPLSGSVKPNETNYKTILLKKNHTLCFHSVHLIESAIACCQKFEPIKPNNEHVKDAMNIDLTLIESTWK